MKKKVKICGITNLEDALISIEAGANAIGFVFYEKSPRFISPEKTAEIISQLPPFVEKVGLFVNNSVEEMNLIAKKSKITLAQLHFETEDLDLTKLEVPFIRVIRAKTPEDLNLYSDEFRIVDAFVPEYGGMGKKINLDWFENRDNSKIILAGGLTPENISETLKYDFYGLDVSSGVEESKGMKSQKKIFNFINTVKS